MRVVVLNDYGSVNGGAAQVAISSLNALADLGIDVTFVFSVGPVDPSIDSNRINIFNLGFSDLLGNPSKTSAALNGLWNFHCAIKLYKILLDYSPSDTIIHLHSWSKSLTSSVVRVAVKRGFRIICTLHDYFAVCPNGGLYNYQKQLACNIMPMSLACVYTNCDVRSYSQKIWRISRQFVQQYFGTMPYGISNFITVSSYSEDLLRKHLPSKVVYHRVSNPINVEQSAPAKPQDNTAFLFVGRLSSEKGAIVFSMASKLSGVRAQFVGIGNEYESILAANSNAEMIGWQPHAEVLKLIGSSRALVFPSLCHETQGLTVMEAAALGIPSIVADTCAAREAIVDGVTGLIFRSNDIVDLSCKLNTLNSNPEYAHKLGAAAYEKYWASSSTLDNHVSCLLRCYYKILDKKNCK
jgi:glycosyltransferase involved in cell wall biosynthesis